MAAGARQPEQGERIMLYALANGVAVGPALDYSSGREVRPDEVWACVTMEDLLEKVRAHFAGSFPRDHAQTQFDALVRMGRADAPR